jgi:hypothetical protein
MLAKPWLRAATAGSAAGAASRDARNFRRPSAKRHPPITAIASISNSQLGWASRTT